MSNEDRALTQDSTPNAATEGRNPPPDQFRQMLDLQVKQLEIREKELELEARAQTNNFEYSQELIKAQERDNQNLRDHNQRALTTVSVVISFGLLVLFGFMGFCVYAGKSRWPWSF